MRRQWRDLNWGVVQLLSRIWLCNPMDCSTPGFPVLHHLPEFAQTHVHWLGDAIQPSHPVLPFSSCLQSFPPSGSFPMTQLFTSGGQSIGASASAPVLPMNIKGWFPLGLTGLISLLSKGLSRVFSSTTVQRYQFFGAQPFNIYILLKYSWLTMFQVHSKVIQLYKYTYIIFEIIFHHRLLQDIDSSCCC